MEEQKYMVINTKFFLLINIYYILVHIYNLKQLSGVDEWLYLEKVMSIPITESDQNVWVIKNYGVKLQEWKERGK